MHNKRRVKKPEYLSDPVNRDIVARDIRNTRAVNRQVNVPKGVRRGLNRISAIAAKAAGGMREVRGRQMVTRGKIPTGLGLAMDFMNVQGLQAASEREPGIQAKVRGARKRRA